MVIPRHIYDKLNFGTAGIPLGAPDRNILDGIEYVKTLGLSALELEFVRSVNISREKAPLVKEAAKKNGIELTCHGQYFINLNSLDKKTTLESAERIINAATIADMCGAKSLTFHAAYYMKLDNELVFQQVLAQLKAIVSRLHDEGNKISIRPETTGKGTQFGTVEEIIKLSQEIEGVLPCVDFSHLHARSGGKFNTKLEFDSVFSAIETELGKEALNSIHCHVSGINYSEKGERNHLMLNESDFNYADLMKSLKDFGAKGVVICESPNIEEDAILMKNDYDNIN